MKQLFTILQQILDKNYHFSQRENILSPKNIDLTSEKLSILETKEDWSQVNLAFFGNIFEQFINKKDRHSYGIHYTSELDIMKIVRPTISDYWEEKINAANTIKELNKLQLELQNYKVLDPACGSGNFLYVAYQELKRIEQVLISKINEKKRSNQEQLMMSFVTPHQFYGMDINPFAVELARVTLMIARKVAIDKFNLREPALPLDSLDNNIICQDALFSNWVKTDAIIGNPPFLGGKNMRLNLGDEYVDRVFEKYPKDVDFCTYWFRLAHDNIDQKGRIGLVATNSISQGKSRKISLDYITQNNGYIHSAISTQEWSGEAKVYVSIINWSKVKSNICFLDNKQVNLINSSLTSVIDVTQSKTLNANLNQCFQGVIPNGKGFIVTEEDVKEWIKKDVKNQKVLKLFSMGANLAKNPLGKPDRWIIDFDNMSLEAASDYELPFEKVKSTIPFERQNNRNNKLTEYWWLYEGKRLAMREKIKNLSYYFTVPRVSKWAIFIPAPLNWLPGDLNIIVASEDYYILGILTSNIHRLWVNAQSSTLGETTRYTHKSCFETFPFPQTPIKNTVEKIRKIMMKIHEYRTEQMKKKQWGITQLYNNFFNEPSSQLYKLHQELDQLVMEIYGFNSDDDILEKLLKLNLELTEKEQRGEKVIGCKY